MVWLVDHHPLRYRLWRRHHFRNEASLHRLRPAQQPLVNNLMLAIDFGLGMILVHPRRSHGLEIVRPIQKKGRWTEEVSHELSEEVTQ